MEELTLTEMMKKIDERAKEFIKNTDYKDWDYQYTRFEDDKAIILVGKSFRGEWDSNSLEVLSEEFNSENGIQMYFDRMKKEEIEWQQKLDEIEKEQEEKNKQLRYEMYLRFKKEFENNVLEEK